MASATALFCLAGLLPLGAQPAPTTPASPSGQQPASGASPSGPTEGAPAAPPSAPAARTGSEQQQLREVKVESSRPRKKNTTAVRGHAPVPAPAPAAAPATTTDTTSLPPLQQTPELGKTGTKIGDLPARVQIIPHQTFVEQGSTMLRQTITNASGVNEGGQDSLGYFDHFLIRGLNAQIYSDGFSDGDQLGGVSHSLNGVQRIEILEGPGSALFGSGPPGGTINLVHFLPSPVFQYGGSLLFGSFGTVTNNNYVTGPTTIPGLNYRVDTTLTRTDGFRDLAGRDYEIRPDFTWNVNNHTFEFSLDARRIHATPDSCRIIYFNGSPLSSVPITAKYSTSWAFANQDYLRPVISDSWFVNDMLTVNNRFSYTRRRLDVMRNGDSTSTTVNALDQVVGRQLREQNDVDNSYDYQFEPVWKFRTGPVGHTLLTGFEAVHQTTDTNRMTADLPNIPNAFAPVPPETSANGLTFQCDAKHSCDNDHLAATYLSAYATDQIDVTEQFKLRAGVRQDWWDTALTPLITVPGRFTRAGVPLVAGVTQDTTETPVSWNAGALYKILPGIAPYVGVSKSYLSNFNSENTQQGIGAPESALQYEGGIKFSMLNERVVLTTAVFDIARNNVAAAVTINGVETVVFDDQRTRGAEASTRRSSHRPMARPRQRDGAERGHHRQSSRCHLNRQSPSGGSGLHGQPVEHLQVFRPRHSGIPGWRRPQLPRPDIQRHHQRQLGAGVRDLQRDARLRGSHLGRRLRTSKNITNQRYYVAANAAGAYVGDPLGAYVTVHFKNF